MLIYTLMLPCCQCTLLYVYIAWFSWTIYCIMYCIQYYTCILLLMRYVFPKAWNSLIVLPMHVTVVALQCSCVAMLLLITKSVAEGKFDVPCFAWIRAQREQEDRLLLCYWVKGCRGNPTQGLQRQSHSRMSGKYLNPNGTWKMDCQTMKFLPKYFAYLSLMG